MKKHSKVETEKQKERDLVYRDAQAGDIFAQKTLRDEYGYMVIMVKGKQVNLREV